MSDLPDPIEHDAAFELADTAAQVHAQVDNEVHIFGKAHAVCGTDKRGHEAPRGASREELVVDGTEGFIPLWDSEVTLRWRFNLESLSLFSRPKQAAAGLRKLMGEAILGWGDSVPVKFVERKDAVDFEVIVREADRCSTSGCVLASAFFPDAGRHELRIYPEFFNQAREEQVETFMHEFGHVFGLRHFFALVSETSWPAVIYGEHDTKKPFSIMNYGANSFITEPDRRDLRNLYEAAWSGELTHINGTQIKLMRPYHESRRALRPGFASLASVLEMGMRT